MKSYLFACCIVLATSLSTFADPYTLRCSAPAKFFPEMKMLVLVTSGEPGPSSPKHQAIAKVEKYSEAVALKGVGPFDLWWVPRSGIPVKVVSGLKLKQGDNEIKLESYLGIVEIRGDDLPRAGLGTIAPQDDPGPDEKGHQPIQTAKDYRVDMVVPEGFYSLWVNPDNNARPKKVNDRFRVLAGKRITLD